MVGNKTTKLKQKRKFNLVIKNWYDEKKLVALRKRVFELFYNHRLSKRYIARKLKISRNFVVKWTKKRQMDFTADHRGWAKGNRRKWDKQTEERIRMLHKQLQDGYYQGATAITLQWKRKFPAEPLPPLRTIGQIAKDLELTNTHRKHGGKGAAKLLCYPEHSIHHYMSGRVLEIDFIGKKFISGRTAPLNFIGCSFKYPPKLRYFKRIESETADELIRQMEDFFYRFEKPQGVKMDNGFAMAGSAPHVGIISKFPLWLLQQQVIPIYAVPRKPFSQASIEGNNSIFARKFWNRFRFQSVEQIDQLLPSFNEASVQYCQYQAPKHHATLVGQNDFVPKIFFLRQVRENRSSGYIEVANTTIPLPKDYIHYFIFAQWNLTEEKISVFIEKNQTPELILSDTLKINKKSREKLKEYNII